MKKVVAGDILHLSDVTYPEGVTSVALKRNSNLAVATVTGKNVNLKRIMLENPLLHSGFFIAMLYI